MRLFIVLFFFFSVSCNENLPPPDMTDPGQLLFMGYARDGVNCSRCHGPEGQGGNEAPDIRNVFSKRDSAGIIEIIEHGTGEGPEDMPSFEQHLDQTDLLNLFEFLKTLQVKKTDKTASPNRS